MDLAFVVQYSIGRSEVEIVKIAPKDSILLLFL